MGVISKLSAFPIPWNRECSLFQVFALTEDYDKAIIPFPSLPQFNVSTIFDNDWLVFAKPQNYDILYYFTTI